MQIPFGRRSSDRPIGRVADFCPFCRGFRPFQVMRIESVRYFYTVALGDRRVEAGHSKVCESCRSRTRAVTENYRAVSADPDADLETLIVETNPEIRRNWASRMLLEDRIKARKLTAGERTELLREPFDLADEILKRRDTEGRLDPATNLGCLATFLLPLACLTLLPLAWKSASSETIETATVIAAGLCLVFTFFAVVSDPRRHARREILPRLVTAIRPLEPSSEDIDLILESLKAARSPLTELIGQRDVSNALLERWD